MKCANCGIVLTAKMEVEYSAWMTEYFCSPKCATNKYFEYMQSVPVDFENLPATLAVVNGKLEAAEQPRAADGGRALCQCSPSMPTTTAGVCTFCNRPRR